MADLWSLAIPATIGAVTWLYQKTWERHERRLKQYEEIIDHLPAFTAANLDPDRIDRILGVARRLWVIGPDEVVWAFDAFIESVSAGQTMPDNVKQEALANLVLAMRKDATFASALVPRFRTRLRSADIKLNSATRPVARNS